MRPLAYLFSISFQNRVDIHRAYFKLGCSRSRYVRFPRFRWSCMENKGFAYEARMRRRKSKRNRRNETSCTWFWSRRKMRSDSWERFILLLVPRIYIGAIARTWFLRHASDIERFCMALFSLHRAVCWVMKLFFSLGLLLLFSWVITTTLVNIVIVCYSLFNVCSWIGKWTRSLMSIRPCQFSISSDVWMKREWMRSIWIKREWIRRIWMKLLLATICDSLKLKLNCLF